MFSKEGVGKILESIFLLQNYDKNNAINGVTGTIAVLFQLYFIAIPLYKWLIKRGPYIWILVEAICFLLKRTIYMT